MDVTDGATDSQLATRNVLRRSRFSIADARVLVIDDDADNLEVFQELLRVQGFVNIETISDPRQALPMFSTYRPDVILLDLQMPHLSGIQVMEQLLPRMPREAPVPIIVLTGDLSRKVRREALAAGASDFITKPFDPIEIGLRMQTFLELRGLQLQLRNQNRLLEGEVRSRTMELEEAHAEILGRLALAGEYRDDETGQHANRVGRMAGLIAEEMGLPEDQIKLIMHAAPLHDIGKVAVSDSILLKPGPLTDEEWELVKTHADVGARILAGSDTRLLQTAQDIALTHHERWDGTGYFGLPEESIPLVGRIVALADVFDALTHDRPYKKAWTIEDAVAEIMSQAGRQFDPEVVRAFLKIVFRAEPLEEDTNSMVDLREDATI